MRKSILATTLLAAIAFTGAAQAGDCAKSKPAKATLTSMPVTGHAATSSNIVETAKGAGQFGTLLAAAQAAGLVATLSGPGPLTVFAPTDAAFAALPAGTVERLLRPENKHELATLLKYHVVAGKVTSDQLAGKITPAKTVNGAKVVVDGTRGVRVNTANVVTADVIASNGVIHVIDRVLIPG